MAASSVLPVNICLFSILTKRNRDLKIKYFEREKFSLEEIEQTHIL